MLTSLPTAKQLPEACILKSVTAGWGGTKSSGMQGRVNAWHAPLLPPLLSLSMTLAPILPCTHGVPSCPLLFLQRCTQSLDQVVLVSS